MKVEKAYCPAHEGFEAEVRLGDNQLIECYSQDLVKFPLGSKNRLYLPKMLIGICKDILTF